MTVWPIQMKFSQKENLFIRFFTQNHVIQWQKLPWDTKYQNEFVFKLYVAQYISSNQLILISQKFENNIVNSSSLLICACENPERLIEYQKFGRYWSKFEIPLLVTCWMKCNGNFDKFSSLLPEDLMMHVDLNHIKLLSYTQIRKNTMDIKIW